MRRTIATALLAIGLVASAGATPASADHEIPTKPGANRQTFTFNDCFTYEDIDGTTVEICYDDTYTSKVISNLGNGLYLVQSRYNSIFTETRNGVVTESTSSGSYTFKARDGVETLYKSKFRGSFENCEYSYKIVVVKGVVKVMQDNFDDFTCFE